MARMAFDPNSLQDIERKRYVLEHAPAILCALIVRRASTEPSTLIDLAAETASALYDRIDPPRTALGVGVAHRPNVLGTA